MFTAQEIDKVLSIINHHYTMMVFTSLGEEALSDTDRLLLESYGVNIEELSSEFPPFYQMFLLGRLANILSDKQINSLDKEDFDKYLSRGQFIPLSEREREEYRVSREMTYGHLKGLANKITTEARDIILEENKKQIINEEISQGVKDRLSISDIVSNLGHRTGDWERDWKRIVITEMQDIYNQGKTGEIVRKYGDEALVWKHTFPLACRHCIRLHLTNGIGSQPRIFTVKELIKNGNNYGRKVDEWLPIIGPNHAHCRCDIQIYFKGQVWNQENKQFEYDKGRERLIERKSKIKLTIGDKELWV